MEAADDVELGDRFGVAGGGGRPGLFERHGVGAGLAFFAAERAQAAGRDADVGGVDVAIDVEVGDVAVESLADEVGEPADGEDVAGLVEGDAVIEGEALTRVDFGGDGEEARVVGLEGVPGPDGLGPRCEGRAHTEILCLGVGDVAPTCARGFRGSRPCGAGRPCRRRGWRR